MSSTTIGSTVLAGNWPSDWGTSGTLGVFTFDDFVSDAGVAYQAGTGESLTGEFVTKATITVGSSVGTVASYALPQTDLTTPANTPRYFGRIFDSRGTPQDFLFESYHLRSSLGASISFLQWAVDNATIYRPQLDGYLTSTQVNTAITAAVTNAALNQDYVIGSYASLSAAIDAMPATGATLVINAATTCTSNKTVPAYVTLRFTGKGYITVSNAVTLTIAGAVEAGPWKIFYNALSGQGTISFSGNKSIPAYYSAWFGTTNGTVDSAAAVNAFLVALPNFSTGVFTQSMSVASTVLMQNKVGIRLTTPSAVGSTGNLSPTFTWIGAAHGTVIKILDSRGWVVENLSIIGTNPNNSNHADIGLDIDQSNPIISGITSDSIVNRSIVTFTNNSSATRCIRISHLSPSNVEQIRVWNSTLYPAGSTDNTNVNRGIGIEFGVSANILSEEVIGTNISNAAVGIQVGGGGGTFARNPTENNSIEYKITGQSGPITIQGNVGEGARQFLVMPTGGENVVIRENEFSYGGGGVDPWIDLTGNNAGGSLKFRDNIFTSGFETVPVFGTGSINAGLESGGNTFGANDITFIGFENFGDGFTSDMDVIGGEARGFFGSKRRVKNSTVSYTAKLYDSFITMDATAGNRTVTLPTAFDANRSGTTFTIKKIDSSANTVTISGDANIDSAATYVLTSENQAVTITLNRAGNLWEVTSQGFNGITGTGAAVLATAGTIAPTSVAATSFLKVNNTGKFSIVPKTNDTYSNAMTIDVTISNHVIAASNTTSATTTLTPSAAGSAGDWLFIDTVADASGTVTSTFAATFHPSGTQATTASHFSSIAFKSNGSLWIEQYRTTNLA